MILPPDPPWGTATIFTGQVFAPRGCAPAGVAPDAIAATVTLQPGWNLVSAAEGSCVVGQNILMYRVFTSLRQYEQLNSDYQLLTYEGYWVYAPDGGILQMTNNLDLGQTTRTVYELSIMQGNWYIIGNSAPHGTMHVDGVSELLVYTPGQGYQQVSELAPGQAGFCLADVTGAITLTLQ